MGPAHLSSKAEQTGEQLSPSRRWDEPPVLLALAAIFLGAVAAGGLGASAALHVGLAPEYFEEATAYGVFFAAASVAAALLAWPARPAYVAGVGLTPGLVVLWTVFQFVTPPGRWVYPPSGLQHEDRKGHENDRRRKP